MNENNDIFTIGDALAASNKQPKQKKKSKTENSEKKATVVEATLVDKKDVKDLSTKDTKATLVTSEKVTLKAQFKSDKDLEKKSEKFKKSVSDLVKNKGMKDEYPLRKIDDFTNGKKPKNNIVKNVGIGVAVAAGVSMLAGFLLKDD